MYSIGYHGPQDDLLENLKPLLVRILVFEASIDLASQLKHKVDAYLSGHDHMLMHFDHEDVHYFVSGMAGTFTAGTSQGFT